MKKVDIAVPNNSKVIHFVVTTVCIAAIIGVGTEAMCVIYKIPDMGGPIGGGFTHTVDTIIGALIAMLINTRPQEQRAAEITGTITTNGSPLPTQPTEVTIVNPPSDPANVIEVKKP